MVTKVDHTVDYSFKSYWPTVDSRDFKKKIATVATSRQSIFRGFCCEFYIGFQWENGRIRTKWPQNLQNFPSKSTLDYVADPRSCNSWLFSRKLTILSTMVSKVDQLSTSQNKSIDCRLLKKKSRNSRFIVKSRLSTSRLDAGAYSRPSEEGREGVKRRNKTVGCLTAMVQSAVLR
jgi:hypothetical protein